MPLAVVTLLALAALYYILANEGEFDPKILAQALALAALVLTLVELTK